jgi:Holliday junction resolvase
VARASRDKGARGEREVAAIFRAAGFDCDRVPNSGGLRLKGDLYGTLPLHVEVKRRERFNVWEAVAQAEAEADGRPAAVAFRRNRSGWYAVVPLADLAALLAAAASRS